MQVRRVPQEKELAAAMLSEAWVHQEKVGKLSQAHQEAELVAVVMLREAGAHQEKVGKLSQAGFQTFLWI